VARGKIKGPSRCTLSRYCAIMSESTSYVLVHGLLTADTAVITFVPALLPVWIYARLFIKARCLGIPLIVFKHNI